MKNESLLKKKKCSLLRTLMHEHITHIKNKVSLKNFLLNKFIIEILEQRETEKNAYIKQTQTTRYSKND